MEHFAWLSDLQINPNGTTVVATGPGFTTMTPVEGGYASVLDLRAGRTPGWLVSSTALLQVVAKGEVRYLALRRSDDALVAPGCWQAPAGRMSPGELPLGCAVRELAEEVRISGAKSNWNDVLIHCGGSLVDYLTEDTVHHLRARFVFMESERTLEFYCPMVLELDSFDDVKFEDNEHYGCQVELFSQAQLAALAEKDLLTAPYEAMLRQRGVLPD